MLTKTLDTGDTSAIVLGMDAAMSEKPKRKVPAHVIGISEKARALLDREVARIQQESGGLPNAGVIASHIIIEALERKDSDQ